MESRRTGRIDSSLKRVILIPDHLPPESEPLREAVSRTSAKQGDSLFPTHGNSMSPAPPDVPIHGEEVWTARKPQSARVCEAARTLSPEYGRKISNYLNI